MSLAIIMGLSMLPVVFWMVYEMKEDSKREKNKHRSEHK